MSHGIISHREDGVLRLVLDKPEKLNAVDTPMLVALRDGLARGTVAYAGDPGRSYFPDRHFARVAEYSVPVSRELEDAEIKRTAVWCFTG